MLRKMFFDNKPQVLLRKMLDKAALNQRVISSNIANIGTSGYRKLGVSFEEKLKNALRPGLDKMSRTNPRHMPDHRVLKRIRPEVVEVENGYWNGINNVNIDEEMVARGKNQLDFNIAVKLLNGRFMGLRTAIKGRK